MVENVFNLAAQKLGFEFVAKTCKYSSSSSSSDYASYFIAYVI